MSIDFALFILRVVLGVVFIGHGGQKLFGWFGGGGIQGTNTWIGKMGMRPVWLWGPLAALTEFGGGVLVLLGFLSPLGSLGIAAAMLMAITKVHWTKGFWAAKGGYEFPLMNLAAALTIGFAGAGAYSVDAVLRTALPEPTTWIAGLLLVVLGEIAAFLSIAPKPAQTAAPSQQRG